MSTAFRPETASGMTGANVRQAPAPSIKNSSQAVAFASPASAIKTSSAPKQASMAAPTHSYGNSAPSHVTHETRSGVQGLPHMPMAPKGIQATFKAGK